MKQSDLILSRLKNIMTGNRMGASDTLVAAIKSDITQVLKSYMYIDISDVSISIESDEDGFFHLELNAVTSEVFSAGKMVQ